MKNFEVIRKDENEITILKIQGFLDAHTAPKFEQAIQELISENRYKLIISMAGLDYISSAGLGVFMGFIEQIRDNNGDIKLTNMSKKVYKVFDLLGFPSLYDIYENESEAKEKFIKSK